MTRAEGSGPVPSAPDRFRPPHALSSSAIIWRKRGLAATLQVRCIIEVEKTGFDMIQEPAVIFICKPDAATIRKARSEIFWFTVPGRAVAVSIAVGLVACGVLAWSTRTWLAPLVMAVVWTEVLIHAFGRYITALSSDPKVRTTAGIVTCTVSNAGLLYESDTKKLNVPWSSIRRVIEIPIGFVLYRRGTPILISNAWFEDADSRRIFVGILRAQTDGSGRLHPMKL
jgi:hypothetical protein